MPESQELDKPTIAERLVQLIEELSTEVRDLRAELETIKKEKSSLPVITSRLEEENITKRQQALSSPGMKAAVDQVLKDWADFKRKHPQYG